MEWLSTSGTAVLWVNVAENRIAQSSSEALQWLAAFFDASQGLIPPGIKEWLSGGGVPRQPYEKRLEDERLRISACHEEDGHRLLVLSRLRPAFGRESLREIGLSRAESEIIPWLIRGKRNDEIAMILGLANKTIEKHVAKVLSKLKVETRTAAAWSIIERTGAHW